jgi:hypothetical protein
MYAMMMLDKQGAGCLQGFEKKYPNALGTHQHWYIQIYYVDAAKAILHPSGVMCFFIHLQEGYKTFHPPI